MIMNERISTPIPQQPLEENTIGPAQEAPKVAEKLPEGVLVSKEGTPLTLYRGSSLPLSLSKDDRYNPEHLGHSTEAPSAGEAFFFTDRRKTAVYYSRGKNPNLESAIISGGDPHVDTVHLVMKNPFIHDFKGKINRREEETYFNLLRKARENGHDGVIFRNTFDAGELNRIHALMDGNLFGETIYGVFNPENILVQETRPLVDPRKKERILEQERKRREHRQLERVKERLKMKQRET
jgi:hypothetical protein